MAELIFASRASSPVPALIVIGLSTQDPAVPFAELVVFPPAGGGEAVAERLSWPGSSNDAKLQATMAGRLVDVARCAAFETASKLLPGNDPLVTRAATDDEVFALRALGHYKAFFSAIGALTPGVDVVARISPVRRVPEAVRAPIVIPPAR